MREHIQTWIFHSSPPLSSKGFDLGTGTSCLKDAAQMCAEDAYVTQWDYAVTWCELTQVTYTVYCQHTGWSNDSGDNG